MKHKNRPAVRNRKMKHAIYIGPTGVHIGVSGYSPLLPGEVRIRILAAGICEADRRVVQQTKLVQDADYIGVLGHDAIGKVLSVSKEAQKANIKRGDIVAILPHIIPDGEKAKEAWLRGEIFRLNTKHLGMNAGGLGVFAHELTLPAENVMPIPGSVIARARTSAVSTNHHWSAGLAELEHLACVLLGWKSIREAETKERSAQAILETLESEGGNVLIAGAGWMGYLWLVYLSDMLPQAKFYVTEPNLERWLVFKRCASHWGAQPILLSHSVGDDPHRGTMDLVIYANANRQSAKDLLKWVKPDGHISLFSGINNGDREPVYDATGFVDLEKIHRKGGWKYIHLSEDPTGPQALASGSSGYSLETFREAITRVPKYITQIAMGVTGVVLGLAGDSVMSYPTSGDINLPPSLPYKAKQGNGFPVLVDLFSQDIWDGRHTHLKVICHPWADIDDINRYYQEWVVPP